MTLGHTTVLQERPIMDSLLMNVSGLLANLSYKNDNNRAKVMQVGAVQSVISYIAEEGAEGTVSATSEGSLRRNITISALLQNLTAGAAFRAKIVGLGGVKVLLSIVSKGKNKDMVRYSLGALRNLANDPAIQRQLVDEGLLDACIHVSTYYGEGDTFEDSSTPVEHAACIVRNLCGNDQIRNMVRKNNALQHLSKQVDPASKSICEDYVRLKPDLNPADVMVAYLSHNGDVLPELCGTTDNATPAFPPECAHLKGDVGAHAAWGAILHMMNQLWLQYEAPRPDLAELLELMEEDKAREAAKKKKKGHDGLGGADADGVDGLDMDAAASGKEGDELESEDAELAHLGLLSPLHSPPHSPQDGPAPAPARGVAPLGDDNDGLDVVAPPRGEGGEGGGGGGGTDAGSAGAGGGGKRSMCCTCTRLALPGTRAWRRKRRGGTWQRCCAIVWPSSNAIPALSKGPTSE